MKTGYPRPRTFVGQTSRSPYAKHRNGNYGDKWNNREYPHPYTASDDNVANISTARLKQSVIFKLCGVCGEPVEDEEVGLILYNMKSRLGYGHDDWINSESGPYHLPCLNVALKNCPHLAETKLFMPGYAKWTDVRQLILDQIE